MKVAGIKWLALNLGDDHGWDDWRIVIERARAIDVVVMPWARCRTIEDCYSLLDTADLVSFHAILNLEDELKDELTPARVSELIRDFDVEVGISTVGWLYNSVDYLPLAGYPVLLQLFPTDMRRDPADLEQIQAECVFHAHAKGFTYTGITAQTYGDAVPEWYAYMNGGTRSFYTGDDIGAGNWSKWA